MCNTFTSLCRSEKLCLPLRTMRTKLWNLLTLIMCLLYLEESSDTRGMTLTNSFGWFELLKENIPRTLGWVTLLLHSIFFHQFSETVLGLKLRSEDWVGGVSIGRSLHLKLASVANICIDHNMALHWNYIIFLNVGLADQARAQLVLDWILFSLWCFRMFVNLISLIFYIIKITN